MNTHDREHGGTSVTSPLRRKVSLRRVAKRLGHSPFVPPLVGVVCVLVVWQLLFAAHLVAPQVLPSPRAVLVQFGSDASSASFWANVSDTVQAAVLGLAIGFVGGVVAAIVMAVSQTLHDLLQPFVVFLNALPRAILAPFFVLMFGLGMASGIALAASLVFFVVLVAVLEGLEAIPQELSNSLRMMGAKETTIWRRVNLPGAFPRVVGSLRVSVSLALLGAVVGELLVASSGIGWLLKLRGQAFQVPGVFSGLLGLALIVAVGNALVDALSRTLIRWQ